MAKRHPAIDYDELARRPGAKVIGINLDALSASGPSPATRDLVAPPARVYPGETIARFEVPLRAVPWTPPRVTEHGVFKDARLSTWQVAVATYARQAMSGRPAFEGDAGLEMAFTIQRGRSGSPPDLTNLVKSTEDALQGIVIANDRAVCESRASRRPGADDLVVIRVYAI